MNTLTSPMPCPGSRWRAGKKDGTWFRYVPVLGPCVAEAGNITCIRHGVTVPFSKTWAVEALRRLPSELVLVSGKCQGRTIQGIIRLPIAARRRVMWHKDGACTGVFSCSPTSTGDETLSITGAWKQDDSQGVEAILFCTIA
jgi:hypothetical protein